MTRPRRVVAGTTYIVTRRCAQREALFDPTDPAIAALFRYLIAVYARRYNIVIHAVCVMSNHIHIVLTDLNGCLPEFCRDLFGLSARAVNARTGHDEAVWSSEAVDTRELLTEQDVLDALTYVMANPVHHDAVDRPESWPGLVTRPSEFSSSVRPARPSWYFKRRSRLPARAEYVVRRPEVFSHLSDAAWQQLITQSLDARVAQELRCHEAKRAGRARPAALRPGGECWRPCHARQQRETRPALYSSSAERLAVAMARRDEFLFQHARALLRWRDGERETVFPDGTWLMRVLHHARCATPDGTVQPSGDQ